MAFGGKALATYCLCKDFTEFGRQVDTGPPAQFSDASRISSVIRRGLQNDFRHPLLPSVRACERTLDFEGSNVNGFGERCFSIPTESTMTPIVLALS